MYYLTDFPNYQDEFEYTDNVIIAAGINDITRKYLTPEIICDAVLPRIRVIYERYSNTVFTFNTILLTMCHKTTLRSTLFYSPRAIKPRYVQQYSTHHVP